MKIKNFSQFVFSIALILAFAVCSAAQEKIKASKAAATFAYAEVLANRIEAEADLKVLTLDYSDDAPQVKAKKLERDLLGRQIRWLEALPDSSQPKMTVALGKLLVRKALAEAALKTLNETYAEQHPLMKKARARFEVYNSEIEKLLQ